MKIEALESRFALSAESPLVLTDVLDIEEYQIQPHVTTRQTPSFHQIGTGTPYDGVVHLEVSTPGGTQYATGTLLPSGRHILTAAHILSTATSISVRFDVPGGDVFKTVLPGGFHAHPSWNGNLVDGNDIAVLTLPSLAPSNAPRFDIYRGGSEFLANVSIVGYGYSGQGAISGSFPPGVKRGVTNRYEAIYDPDGDILMYDFDNGLAANDTIGIASGGALNNVGGVIEGLGTTGDSGAPAFFNNRIMGVHSFGLYGATGDISPGAADSSYGELGADTRVSFVAGFIDGIVDEAGAPTITDVVLRGSSWSSGVDYAFSDLVAVGDQLRPIATQNVNTLSIQFSENVRLRLANGTLAELDGSVLELAQTTRNSSGNVTNTTVTPTGFSYDPGTHVATWTFSTPLADGKYAIHLKSAGPGIAGVVDVGGNALDGEWVNNSNGTPDNYLDDPNGVFDVGNGVAGSPNNEFRLHFALQAGDYNGDGAVDATDLSSLGDGNGDGVVNSSDNAVQAANLNELLPLRRVGGADFYDDEIVDGADLAIWSNGYGTGVAGDADGDGDSDGADFLLWQRVIGSYSSWHQETTMAAPALLAGSSPQVLNVIISGSASAHAPFSFDTVDGSGLQLRTVPVGGADTISIQFSEDMNIATDSLVLIGMTTANVPSLAEFSYNPLTFTASWRYDGWDKGDNYLITLAETVTDVHGNWLDGEWTNPASVTTVNAAISEFPSGDGTPGGAFSFVITLLPGDANLDGLVDMTDFSEYFNYYGPTTGRSFAQGDFDGDGVTGDADGDLLLANWQVDLRNLRLLADFDGDWDVDDDDIYVIDQNGGMTGATWADGDLDGDGDVTVDDLDLAYAQLGMSLDIVI